MAGVESRCFLHALRDGNYFDTRNRRGKKEGTGKGKAILKVVGQFLVHLPKATVEFDGLG